MSDAERDLQRCVREAQLKEPLLDVFLSYQQPSAIEVVLNFGHYDETGRAVITGTASVKPDLSEVVSTKVL